MSEWKQGGWVTILLFWMALFSAPVQAESADQDQELLASAVQAVPASGVQAVPACEVQAVPASGVQVVPASGVQAVPACEVQAEPTPAENFEAGVKADKAGNVIGALELLKKAADAGHIEALAKYADTLKKGQLISDAFKYYRMSIQGSADGMYGLGTLYEDGEGLKQDFGVARFLYGLAAERGQRSASFKMADIYLNGQSGLDETDLQGAEALYWLRRAAGYDYLPALDALAVGYKEGKYGLTADPDQAEVIVSITNKLRGVVVKKKERSALFKLLKGDPDKK